VKDFRNLKVWKKSHELTLAVFLATKHFPKEELYGLTSQIRRSCSSIPANIAEGCGRSGDGELGRFLQIAMGSASELEYHFILARDLHLIQESEYGRLNQQVVEVTRMVSSFIVKLNADR
jgi:four helix bundle protein